MMMMSGNQNIGMPWESIYMRLYPIFQHTGTSPRKAPETISGAKLFTPHEGALAEYQRRKT